MGKYGTYSNDITIIAFSFLLFDADGPRLIVVLSSKTTTYPDLDIYQLTGSFNISSVITVEFSDEIGISGQVKIMDNTEIYVSKFFEIGKIKIVKDYEPVNVITFIIIWGVVNVMIVMIIKQRL